MPGNDVIVLNRHVCAPSGEPIRLLYENAVVSWDALMLTIEHDKDPNDGPGRALTRMPMAHVLQFVEVLNGDSKSALRVRTHAH